VVCDDTPDAVHPHTLALQFVHLLLYRMKTMVKFFSKFENVFSNTTEFSNNESEIEIRGSGVLFEKRWIKVLGCYVKGRLFLFLVLVPFFVVQTQEINVIIIKS
jgi:hypothetical protein